MTDKPDKEIKLQVLIATMGPQGMARICSCEHPHVEGVEYIVSWQLPDGPCKVPPQLAGRDDFRIYKLNNRGVARNRNNLFDHATAPLLLIADDDLRYTAEGLRIVIDSFSRYPQCDMLTFKYDSAYYPKSYPEHEFDLAGPVRNYFATSFEIAVRREFIVRNNIRFNPYFGLGSEFGCAEEDLLMADMRRAGARGRFIPRSICRHDGSTTGQRGEESPGLVRAKGASFLGMFPVSWPLRLITHTLRARRKSSYLCNWMRGVAQAWRIDPFGTGAGSWHTVMFWILAFALSVLAGWLSATTVWSDDALIFSFIHPAHDDSVFTQPVRDLADIWHSQLYQYQFSNGRFFCHFLIQIFCSFLGPVWFGVCNGLVWIMLMVLMRRLASRLDHQHIVADALIPMLLWLTVFTFPFQPPYQVNYIWMGAMQLGFGLLFFSPRRRPVAEIILVAIFAFLCGESNESFSIPVSVALLIAATRMRWHLTPAQWCAGIMYGLGTLVCCLAPGNFNRLGQGEALGLSAVHLILPALFVPAIALIIRIALIGERESRNTFGLFWSIAAVCNFLLALILGFASGPRMLTLCNLILGVACAVMSAPPDHHKRLLRVMLIITGVITVLTISYAIERMQFHNTKFRLLYSAYQASADGRVYLDDQMFLDDMRFTIGTGNIAPIEGIAHLTDPAKAPLHIYPETARHINLEALTPDSNLLIPFGPGIFNSSAAPSWLDPDGRQNAIGWLMVRSNSNPARYIIRKRIDLGMLHKQFADREVDFGPASDIVIDSTATHTVAVYINERPLIDACVTKEQ